MRAIREWRSLLFVPATNERFLAKAASRGADAIQLDLEDAIPPDGKSAARTAVKPAAEQLAAQGIDVVVRINRSWLHAFADIEASVCSSVCALTLPKVPSADHVRTVAEILDELERQEGLEIGHTRLIVMIETTNGLINMNAIAAAHPRIVALIVGAEDLAVGLGARPNYQTLYVHNAQAVVAARAAGIQPLGFIGSVADFADEAAFAARIEEARDMGFTGGFCIHPKQVPILNDLFAPSRSDVEWANGVLTAYDEALKIGKGAATYGGAMIDQPVAERARMILSKQKGIARHAR
jgi:citrate lyase subunit beta / citryl-CoA lyase